MGRPITRSIVLAAASSAAVANAQTASGGGALAINGSRASGGVATLDAARRVLASSTSATDNGKTVVLVGGDRSGNAIGETLVLNSATPPYTVQDFLTVTAATISAATVGTVSLGTNGTASTGWVPVSYLNDQFNVGFALNFGGVAANVNVETTTDQIDKAAVDAAPGGNGDSSAAGLPYSTFLPPVPFAVLSGQTVDVQGQVQIPARAIRATVASGAASAGVRFTVIQAGVVG